VAVTAVTWAGTVQVWTPGTSVGPKVTSHTPCEQTGVGALEAAEAVPEEADQRRLELVARTSREIPP
jgi:hypothetical protein